VAGGWGRLHNEGNHNLFASANIITYLLTYLLTHSMVQDIFEKLIVIQLVKQQPAFFWNTKVYYRAHKSPPPDSN
jgi:hypothetical protein